MAHYEGGRHCGRTAFPVEGEIDSLRKRNCSIRCRRGALRRIGRSF